MADHIYKHNTTGNEVLLPDHFAKSPQAANYTDLGEGVTVKDPSTGINSVKLVKELKEANKPAEPAKPKDATKSTPAGKAADKLADKPAADAGKPAVDAGNKPAEEAE